MAKQGVLCLAPEMADSTEERLIIIWHVLFVDVLL
jgi:hypothetical protein